VVDACEDEPENDDAVCSLLCGWLADTIITYKNSYGADHDICTAISGAEAECPAEGDTGAGFGKESGCQAVSATAGLLALLPGLLFIVRRCK
jgi:hypothetical protein